MTFEPVIGLEIHLHLRTKSKMFCACSAAIWGAEPNTHVCPVCLGLPGALPVINKKAVWEALRVALALNCNINQKTFFERKNYFYPDLPKGYQISQYRAPLAVNGLVVLKNKRRVRIKRVHLEEDTAKSLHQDEATLLDFNKSGIPLLEIVTRPDIHSPEEAVEYAKFISETVRGLSASDANMEKGQMRLEGNVSMREKGSSELPDYRVELKNINSFRFLRKALEYEIARQLDALKAGERLKQETRGYDESLGITFIQRQKESVEDYRYFPEPDLPPLKLSSAYLKQIEDSLPEPEGNKEGELTATHKITREQAKLLLKDKKKLDYFRQLVALGLESRTASNLVINRPSVMKETPSVTFRRIQRQRQDEVSVEQELLPVAESVLKQNRRAVLDYQAGKEEALMFLVGQVMRATSGKANATVVQRLLRRKLK